MGTRKMMVHLKRSSAAPPCSPEISPAPAPALALDPDTGRVGKRHTDFSEIPKVG